MDNETLLARLLVEKEVGITYQKRRHEQWRENYQLDRDIVKTNDLTQRQSVNVPLMKETRKTILSRIDEPPDVLFECLESGDAGQQKEIYLNLIWEDDADVTKCNFEAIDLLEKDNVLLQGRTFKMLNFRNGQIEVEVPRNLDIVIDPKTKPLDIETARFIVRMHIKRALEDILSDSSYEQAGKDKLKQSFPDAFKDKESGETVEGPTEKAKEAKEDIEADLEIEDAEMHSAANIEIELTQHFTELWDNDKKEFIRWVIVYANDEAILKKITLEEAIGVKFWPFTTWASDIDAKDFWSDGIADIVRTPNKILNVYLSSMLENRVYRNLGMHWYLPVPGYDPQTFEPEAFGQYPAPMIRDTLGRYMPIDQVIKQWDIPSLDDNLVAINFLIGIVERATAATALEKGVSEEGQQTLGEVRELLGRTSESIMSITKSYRRSWKEFAWKWRKIREANASSSNPIKIYRKGPSGQYYKVKIKPKDWISEEGYKELVVSSSEQEAEQLKGLQKLELAQARFPENRAFQRIYKKRTLDALGLTSDEVKNVMEEERTLQNLPPTRPGAGQDIMSMIGAGGRGSSKAPAQAPL